MADLKKTIDIVLNVEDKASRSINQASDSIGGLNSRFGSMAKYGAQAAAALAAVGAAVTALVAAGLKEAYDQSVQFESALVDLEKVLGSQPELLNQAQKSALEMSTKYGVAATEITNSIAGWVQAGYDLSDATSLADDSLALMYSSEMDAATATKALTKVVKGFGVDVEDARKKLDAINEISNNYAASSGQLAEALGRVAPAASKMGFSMEEIAAIMTPAIEKFQDGEVVGTAFKTILANLADPTGKAKDALLELGLQQGIVNGKFDSGKEIFDAVVGKFTKMDEQQQATIATQIAGKEHFTKFLAAIGDAAKNVEIYNKAMDSAGSITEEVARQLESSENIIGVHGQAWVNLATTIGQQYNDSVDEVIKGSSMIGAALQETVSDGALEPVFKAIRGIFDAMGSNLDEVAEGIPEALEQVDWENLATSISELGDAFGNLFNVDMANPQELADVIQKISDTGANLIDFFARVVDVAGLFTPVIGNVVDAFNSLYKVTTFIIDSAFIPIAGAINVVIEALQALYKGLDVVVPGDFLGDAVDDLQHFQDNMNEMALKSIKNVNEGLAGIGKSITDIPGEKQVGVTVDDKGTAQKTGEKIKHNVPDAINSKANVDDQGTARETGQEIEKEIPAEKVMEVQASLEKKQIEKSIAEIESQSQAIQSIFEYRAKVDTTALESATDGIVSYMDNKSELMQSQIEWEAKLNIAQVEANAQKVEAAFGSLNTVFETGADLIGDMIGAYGELSGPKAWDVENWIDQEMDMREEAFKQQKKLIDAEVKLMNARSRRMSSDKPLIEVNGDGLESELEAFMWKILQTVQQRVAEEEQEFLLGIGQSATE